MLRNLLKKKKECSRNNSTIPDGYFDKYRQKDILDSLKLMYKSLCCYCEARIGIVDYPHIEHRMPKKVYPKYTYDWNNLHLSCTMCNVSKGSKYDAKNPILDAVKDNPITDHLTYEIVWRKPNTNRGNTTIIHTGLNREELRTARQDILLRVLTLIAEINNNANNPENGMRLEQLEILSEDQFGSLIKYAMDSFLKWN